MYSILKVIAEPLNRTFDVSAFPLLLAVFPRVSTLLLIASHKTRLIGYSYMKIELNHIYEAGLP